MTLITKKNLLTIDSSIDEKIFILLNLSLYNQYCSVAKNSHGQIVIAVKCFFRQVLPHVNHQDAVLGDNPGSRVFWIVMLLIKSAKSFSRSQSQEWQSVGGQ